MPETFADFSVWEEQGSVRFAKENDITLVGVQLDDPANDKLPEQADDRRIFDVDGDGKAGITATVSAMLVSGEVHFIQRSITSYTGVWSKDGNTLSGLVKDQSEQSVIDASNDPLKAVGLVSYEPHPDEEKSHIVGMKISNDAACDDIAWDLMPEYNKHLLLVGLRKKYF
ncbi:MAG: hypothetical protein ACOH5I_08840 [Oligoflexus sp.]